MGSARELACAPTVGQRELSRTEARVRSEWLCAPAPTRATEPRPVRARTANSQADGAAAAAETPAALRRPAARPQRLPGFIPIEVFSV